MTKQEGQIKNKATNKYDMFTDGHEGDIIGRMGEKTLKCRISVQS